MDHLSSESESDSEGRGGSPHPYFRAGGDDEEESISEDGAFDSEDEKKYGSFFEGQRRAAKGSSDEESDDEDESDSEDGQDGEYVKLSDLLDEELPSTKAAVASHQSLVNAISSSVAGVATPTGKFEKLESAKEGEFSLAATSRKLTMSELMAGINPTASDSKMMDRLTQKSEKTLVAAPTPQLTKDRQLRAVQYAATSKEVTEWQPTVKAMREQGTLSFPLVSPNAPVLTSGTIVSQFKPQTSLEQAVAGVLQSTELSEKQVLEEEALLERGMTVGELEAREAELMKMKHLMFYKERKFRWHKKIKSRKYRKILRTAKEKGQLTEEELRELDPDAANDLVEKRERERALERMTLKHKTFGKWAKGAKRSNAPHLKQALHDTFEIGKELRRKIEKVENGSDESSDGSESDGSSDSEEEATPTKGVMAMKFMKRAQDREKVEFDQLKEEYDAEHEDKVNRLQRAANKAMGVEEEEPKTSQSSGKDSVNAGRRQFQPKESKTRGSKGKGEKVELVHGTQLVSDLTFGGGFASTLNDTNPTPAPRAVTKSKGDGDALEPSFSTASDKSGRVFSVNQHAELQEEAKTVPVPVVAEKSNADDDVQEDRVLVNRRGGLSGNVSQTTSKHKAKGKKRPREQQTAAVNPWMVSEKAAAPPPAKKLKKLEDSRTVSIALPPSDTDKEGNPSFNLTASATQEQKDLIARAFANDNVQDDFEKEKNLDLDVALPDSVKAPVSLPGWGSWGGDGVVSKPRRRDVQKELDRKKKVLQMKSSRSDAKLSHVILNQKRDKKVVKYTMLNVPYPFKSREAYERSLRNPLGKDWNAYAQHKKLVQPSVKIAAGVIIDPLEKKRRSKK